MIRYSCPQCKKRFVAQDDEAGVKRSCNSCGQRIQVPDQPPPQKNKTVLGKWEEPNKTMLGKTESQDEEPVDVQSVGSLKNVIPDDDDDYEPRSTRRRLSSSGRRQTQRCPECGCTDRPDILRETNTTGWVLFVVLILFFFPVCFLGIMMVDEVEICPECGERLRVRGQAFGWPGRQSGGRY